MGMRARRQVRAARIVRARRTEWSVGSRGRSRPGSAHEPTTPSSRASSRSRSISSASRWARDARPTSRSRSRRDGRRPRSLRRSRAVLRACALGVSFDAALDDAARATPRPASGRRRACSRPIVSARPVGSRARPAGRRGAHGAAAPGRGDTPAGSRCGCSSRSSSWCCPRSCCSRWSPGSRPVSGASERLARDFPGAFPDPRATRR